MILGWQIDWIHLIVLFVKRDAICHGPANLMIVETWCVPFHFLGIHFWMFSIPFGYFRVFIFQTPISISIFTFDFYCGLCSVSWRYSFSLSFLPFSPEHRFCSDAHQFYPNVEPPLKSHFFDFMPNKIKATNIWGWPTQSPCIEYRWDDLFRYKARICHRKHFHSLSTGKFMLAFATHNKTVYFIVVCVCVCLRLFKCECFDEM